MDPVAAVTPVTVAVVPLTVKSAAFTFFTFSLKVTRQTRLLALVGEDDGVWCSTDSTVGAVLSTDRSSKLATSLPAASMSLLSVPEVGLV